MGGVLVELCFGGISFPLRCSTTELHLSSVMGLLLIVNEFRQYINQYWEKLLLLHLMVSLRKPFLYL